MSGALNITRHVSIMDNVHALHTYVFTVNDVHTIQESTTSLPLCLPTLLWSPQLSSSRWRISSPEKQFWFPWLSLVYLLVLFVGCWVVWQCLKLLYLNVLVCRVHVCGAFGCSLELLRLSSRLVMCSVWLAVNVHHAVEWLLIEVGISFAILQVASVALFAAAEHSKHSIVCKKQSHGRV